VRSDTNGDGVLNVAEMSAVMAKMGNTLTEEVLRQHFDELDSDKSGDISKTEFKDWYRNTQYYTTTRQLNEQELAEEEGISLCPMPKGLASKFMYRAPEHK
jgi:Ca2+-binding EF-hand superfamily protein